MTILRSAKEPPLLRLVQQRSGHPRTQTVSVSGEPPYVTSHSYSLNTGFRDTTTVHGITTDFDPTTAGNVLRITDANGHATTFTYDYGVVKNTVTPGYTIERSIDVDGTVKWGKAPRSDHLFLLR